MQKNTPIQGGHKRFEVDAKDTAIKIIDSITSPDFSLPLQQQGLVSNGTMTYIYLNNLTYPYLFEFIAEILHTKIPIIVNDTSFGPGEIIPQSRPETSQRPSELFYRRTSKVRCTRKKNKL